MSLSGTVTEKPVLLTVSGATEEEAMLAEQTQRQTFGNRQGSFLTRDNKPAHTAWFVQRGVMEEQASPNFPDVPASQPSVFRADQAPHAFIPQVEPNSSPTIKSFCSGPPAAPGSPKPLLQAWTEQRRDKSAEASTSGRPLPGNGSNTSDRWCSSPRSTGHLPSSGSVSKLQEEACELIKCYNVTPTPSPDFTQRQVFSHAPRRVRRTLASSGAIPQPCPRQKIDEFTGRISRKRIGPNDVDEDETVISRSLSGEICWSAVTADSSKRLQRRGSVICDSSTLLRGSHSDSDDSESEMGCDLRTMVTQCRTPNVSSITTLMGKAIKFADEVFCCANPARESCSTSVDSSPDRGRRRKGSGEISIMETEDIEDEEKGKQQYCC